MITPAVLLSLATLLAPAAPAAAAADAPPVALAPATVRPADPFAIDGFDELR